MSSRKNAGWLRVAKGNPLGEPSFWAVIDAIGVENERARRAYKTDAQWARIFAAAENSELPEWVWLGLLRQKRVIEESTALGRSPEDRRRDDMAHDRIEADRKRRERELRNAQVAVAASSRGRARIS